MEQTQRVPSATPLVAEEALSTTALPAAQSSRPLMEYRDSTVGASSIPNVVPRTSAPALGHTHCCYCHLTAPFTTHTTQPVLYAGRHKHLMEDQSQHTSAASRCYPPKLVVVVVVVGYAACGPSLSVDVHPPTARTSGVGGRLSPGGSRRPKAMKGERDEHTRKKTTKSERERERERETHTHPPKNIPKKCTLQDN